MVLTAQINFFQSLPSPMRQSLHRPGVSSLAMLKGGVTMLCWRQQVAYYPLHRQETFKPMSIDH
jgi:hypothetical protein